MNRNNRDSFIQEFKSFNISDYEDALSHQVVDCGEGKFSTMVQWQSQDALIEARPALISFLESVRLL